MSHQIDLDKSRLAVFPLTKGLKRYRILKMSARFSQTETMSAFILPPAPGNSIYRRGTQLAQLGRGVVSYK
jgi:hypothetical protein